MSSFRRKGIPTHHKGSSANSSIHKNQSIFRALKPAYDTVITVAAIPVGIASPFVPYLNQAFLLCTIIGSIVDSLEYLHDSCEVLLERIENANKMFVEVGLQHGDSPGNFENDNFSNAFERYNDMLLSIQEYVLKISSKTTLRKIIRGSDHKRRFQKLQSRLDGAISGLTMALNICTHQKLDKIIALNMENKIENDRNLDLFTEELTRFREHVDNGFAEMDDKVQNALKELRSSQTDKSIDDMIRDAIVNPEEVLPFKNEKFMIFHGSRVDREVHPRLMKSQLAEIKREVCMMRYVSNCPYVRHCYGMYEQGSNLVVLLEYTEKGNLRDLMEGEKLCWKDRWNMSFDICQGICFLHACNIIHHDIRSENIVVTDRMQAKLTNFSVSRRQYADSIPRRDGYGAYMRWQAPEKVFKGEDVPYTLACEIYSFGMLLWEIAECSGKIPFYEIPDINTVVSQVCKGNLYRPAISFDVPNAFRDIFTRAWDHGPEKRPTAGDISRMLLEHRGQISDFDRGITTSIEVEEFRDNEFRDNAWDFSLPDEPEFESESAKLLKEAKAFFERNQFANAWTIIKPMVMSGDVVDEYPMALYYAAKILENGLADQNIDLEQAYKWYRLSAELGCHEAEFQQAKYIYSTHKQEAFELFLKSAKGGYAPAMKIIADIYRNGKLKQKKDPQLAQEWEEKYRRAT